MGLFKHNQLFCTICKKSIMYKQKPKREWNLDGFLCGDCYVDEMRKQYDINESNPDTQIQSNTKPVKIQSSKKLGGFWNGPPFAIIQLILGTYLVVSGSEWYFQLIGLSVIVIGSHTLYKYSKTRKQGDALTILKERYAKGEITKEEFDKIKDDLKD